MTKLNWDKIGNEKDFQRFINHLFALECNSPGFVPSSPYIGADSGWDGYFNGFYQYENKSGAWSIQSKWTTKSHKNAIPHLKNEIKKELKNAQKNNVDHLRIATNAELDVNEVRILEVMNKRKTKTLKIWAREDLTMRIEKQPFLRYYFFGDPQFPMFVPWKIYFEQYEKTLLSTNKLLKFERESRQCYQFILKDSVSILIIYAAGGNGKSHLLRDIAKNAHLADDERQCWLIRPGLRNMNDAVQDELVCGRKYILVLDDADRYLEETKALIALAKSQAFAVKIILGVRTSGLDSIRNIVRDFRCASVIEEMPISNWSKQDLLGLLHLVVDKEKIDNEEFIVTHYSNPFILTFIGNHKMENRVMDLRIFQDQIVDSVEYDTEKALSKFNIIKEKLDDLLINIAIVVPFAKNNNNEVIKKLSALSGFSAEQLITYIDKLIEVGVLREIGRSVRFNPDMIGDLYLTFRLDKLNENAIKCLIQRWLGICPETIFNNLAAISRYGDLEKVKITLKRIVYDWIDESHSTPNNVRINRLLQISKVTYFITEEILDLVYAYLRSKAPLSADPIIKVFNVNYELNLDNIGPVITNIMEIPGFQKKAIQLIRELANSELKGTYDNYKPRTLIKEAVSPINHRPDMIKDILAELSVWLGDLHFSIVEAELISNSISEILAGTHAYSQSQSGQFVFGERTLSDTQTIHELRDTALHLLRQLLLYPKLEIIIQGIKTAGSIGRTCMGRVSESKLPLAKRIADDRTKVIRMIATLISPDANFYLLSEIENFLITAWAQDIPGTIEAVELLRKFPRSPDYLVYRYYVAPEYVIENFDMVEKQSPAINRWEWFVNEFMHHRWNLKTDDLKNLVEKIDASYKSPSEVVAYLISLDDNLEKCNSTGNPPLILSWAQLNTDIFKSIRTNPDLWCKIPDRFKNEIDLAISKLDNIHIEVIANEILNRPSDVPSSRVALFIRLIEEGTMPVDIKVNWLTRLINNGSSKNRISVGRNLYFIFEKTKDVLVMIRLMNDIIKQEGPLSLIMISAISDMLHWIRHANLSIPENEEVNEFRSVSLRLMKDVPCIDANGQTVIDFSCSDIMSLLDFTKYRLDMEMKMVKHNGVDFYRFEAIPYEGLKCLSRLIHNYDEYKMILKCVIDWYKRNPLLLYTLEYLISPIIHLKQDCSKETYLEKFIQEQINAGKIDEVLITAGFLKFNSVTMPLLLKVLQEAFKSSLEKSAKRMFSAVVNSGTLTSTPGKPPPVLESKKTILREMCDKCPPGSVRNFIRQVINSIEAEIQVLLQDDEEFLNPKI
ncbi:MAG TPA: hypothetical protein VF399_06485 [bacterium]